MQTWLARLFPVLPAERLAVSVLFTHYLLVSAAVIAGKSARDAFFLTKYDKSILPLMYLANAVCVALAMAMFSRLSKRFSTGVGAAVTGAFFAVTLLLIELNLDGWMVGVLYVWMEVIGTVVILQSWLLTGEAFDPRQAKRLFGVIAAGGSIAAWVGGVSIAWIAGRYGSASLISVVASALAVSVGTAWYAARFRAPRPKSRQPANAGARSPLKLSPYVVSIAILIAAASMVSAIIQYRFQVASAAAYPSRDQLVAFFGQFYAWTGAASLASQLFLSRVLLSRFGVIAGLFVLPASFSVGTLFTLLSPSLWSAGFGRFSDLTFKFTVNNSSIEMLWLPVPPEERQSVKALVSGTLKAVSEAGTAILMFVMVKATPPWVLSAFALMLCAVWIGTVLRLRLQYRAALLKVIEKRQLDSESLVLSGNDPMMVQAIDQSLRSSDEAEQMAALSFLDGMALRPWRNSLCGLLANGSPEIRQRVLALTAGDRSILSDETLLGIARSTGPLASTAVTIAAERGLPGLKDVLEQLIASGNPRTSATAAAAMLGHDLGDAAGARAVLRDWLRSGIPVVVIDVLRLVPHDTAVIPAETLSSLLNGSEVAIRCAAMEVVAARNDISLLPEIVAALADGRCQRAARVALRQLPVEAVADALVAAIETSEDERLRRSAIRLLREYPENAGEERVARCLRTDDLRSWSEYADLLRAVTSVRPLHADVAALLPESRIAIYSKAYLLDALQVQLAPDPDAVLLRDHLSGQYTWAVEATLRLTALRQPAFPVEACLQASNSGDPAMMPYVLELVETTLEKQEVRLIAPLIEPSQVEGRQTVVRTLYTASELQVDTYARKAVSSSDRWEAAVASLYLARKDKLAVGAIAGSGVSDAEEQNMYSTLEKTIILKSSDLFGALPAENLATLSAIATEVRLPAGAVLFKDGDTGDSLYLVTSGRVRIVKGGAEIAALEKGACFGEMAVLDQAPRSADAIIADEAVLLRIGSDEFYEVLAENPALAQGLVRLLTRRLRDANARIARAEC